MRRLNWTITLVVATWTYGLYDAPFKLVTRYGVNRGSGSGFRDTWPIVLFLWLALVVFVAAPQVHHLWVRWCMSRARRYRFGEHPSPNALLWKEPK
jgi:hypothetical protein